MPKTIDMFRSFLTQVQTLLALTPSFKQDKVKIVQCQDYTIFLTYARKFPKKQDNSAPIYRWKVSSILTQDEEGNPLYIFCQGDLFCDNWTYFTKSVPFRRFLNSSLPKLEEKLKNHIPHEHHYLIEQFYDLHAQCGEAAFALKEFIAFDYVLGLTDEEKVKELFGNLSYKDPNTGTFVPYNLSKEEYIVSYLSKFIAKWTDPGLIPKTMKMELGRNASLYGAVLKMSSVEDTLRNVLYRLKASGFEESEYFLLFEFLSNCDCKFEEISGDDPIWAGYTLIGEKPEGDNSILEVVLLLAKRLSITAESEIVGNDYLNTAILNGELPDGIIKQVTADHITAALVGNFTSRKGKLGTVCHELFDYYKRMNE